MTWQIKNNSWPTCSQTIQNQSEQVLSQVEGVTTLAVNRLTLLTGLDGLGGKVTFNRHALSVGAEKLLSLRNELDSLLCQGQVLSVHPYQFCAENSANAAYHLTPANAVKRLANKLLDSHDENRPTAACYAVGIMIAAQNLTEFAVNTSAVFDVLSLPTLGMVSRRATQGVTLEKDKLTLPQGAQVPLFKPVAALNSMPLRSMFDFQGAQLAQLESLAADAQTPIAKLQALAVKRTVHLNKLSDAINKLKQESIEVRMFSAHGTPNALYAHLLQSTPPGPEYTHTFTALLLSQTPLTFIEELFA